MSEKPCSCLWRHQKCWFSTLYAWVVSRNSNGVSHLRNMKSSSSGATQIKSGVGRGFYQNKILGWLENLKSQGMGRWWDVNCFVVGGGWDIVCWDSLLDEGINGWGSVDDLIRDGSMQVQHWAVMLQEPINDLAVYPQCVNHHMLK